MRGLPGGAILCVCAILFLATDAVPIVNYDPVYPPGNITIKVTIDSNTRCTSRPLYEDS